MLKVQLCMSGINYIWVYITIENSSFTVLLFVLSICIYRMQKDCKKRKRLNHSVAVGENLFTTGLFKSNSVSWNDW